MRLLAFAPLALFIPVSLPAWQAEPQLRIVRAIASDSEDGPPLHAGQKLLPGETGYFSFIAENYSKSEEGKVGLTAHVQAFDAADVPLAPRQTLPLETTLSAQDKEYKPKFRAVIEVPSLTRPGTFKIRFDVTDAASRQTASGEASFGVDGQAMPVAAALTIRNLAFYRNQDDEVPLRTPAYRPGEPVWVRFDIVGYKYGAENAVDVAYDVSVTGPDGKPIMQQENAAVDRSMAYYPKPWIPASFQLDLKAKIFNAAYTLVITARDATGKQSVTAQAPFTIQN